MKKPIIIIVAVIVIAAGAYAIFHKSSKPASNPGNGSQSSSQAKAPAVNNSILITKTDPSVGQYLADPSGKALYTYNADTKNVSNCTGSCLAAWPAYVDKGSIANLPSGVGTIKRKDNGKMQYTYNGMPLYYFVSDKPGEVTGDGQQNFSVAKPAASSSSSSSQSSSSPSDSAPAQSSGATSGPTYNY